MSQIWMPHGGHFVGAAECRFRMNTYVNGYIVSTVGEYHPGGEVGISGSGREHGQPYEIGYQRFYETMVFRAKLSDQPCCPFVVADAGASLDFAAYNTAGEAYQGHMVMLDKWAEKKCPPIGEEGCARCGRSAYACDCKADWVPE